MGESFSRGDCLAILATAACSMGCGISMGQRSLEVVEAADASPPAFAHGTDPGPSLESLVGDGPLPRPIWAHRTYSADQHMLLWIDTNEFGETMAGGWARGGVSLADTDLGEGDGRFRSIVVLFDRLGELRWSRVVRGGGVRYLRAIPGGDGFVALLALERAVDLGCGCVPVSGHRGQLLVGFSRDGDCLWQRPLNELVILDVDHAGHVYAVERERVDDAYGVGVGSRRHRAVVSRLSSSGETQWKTPLGDYPDEWPTSLGVFEDTVVVMTHLVCRGEECPDLSERGQTLNVLDGRGRRQWSRVIDASDGRLFVTRAAPGPGGEIYVAGRFVGLLDVGGGPLKSRGGMDGFLVKYDAKGEHVWSRSIGGSTNDAVIYLHVDPRGFAYFSGVMNDEGACGEEEVSFSCLEGTSFVARIDLSSGEVDRVVGLGRDPCMGHVSWDEQGFSLLGPRFGRAFGEEESPLSCGGRTWEAEENRYTYVIRYEWPEPSRSQESGYVIETAACLSERTLSW